MSYLVYTTSLNLKAIVGMREYHCIPAADARSAVYIATGIAAQKKEVVTVLMDSSNTSRSAFSGMTEAFYRKLPVVLVTIGKSLDYSIELKDVVNGHYTASSFDEVELLTNRELPIHVELEMVGTETYLQKISVLPLVGKLLTERDYLYVSQNISLNLDDFVCKVVHGGLPHCEEGALSNILGASLCHKRRRYVGVVTEAEFLHDINTLGNINVNDLLFYIVICASENSAILDCARDLGYETAVYLESSIIEEELEKKLNDPKRTVVMICGG